MPAYPGAYWDDKRAKLAIIRAEIGDQVDAALADESHDMRALKRDLQAIKRAMKTYKKETS